MNTLPNQEIHNSIFLYVMDDNGVYFTGKVGMVLQEEGKG
jgi:hypothetical protein